MIRMKHPLHGFHNAHGNEEADMRKNGWVDDVPEVAPVQELEASAVEQLSLHDQAESLGIKVDKRWSESRLAEEIKKAE